MKVYFAFLLPLFFVAGIYAQAPDLIQYQAVVRDGNGDIVANQLVSFQVSILSGSVTGTVEYSEFHSVTTNDFGLVALQIGGGTPVNGDLSGIGWGLSTHYMKIECDITGGTVWTDMGTVQLLSVPYALYAKKTGNTFSGDYNDLDNLPDFTGWDQSASDDFSGDYNDLTNPPELNGDVTGQLHANTVVKIRGLDVAAIAPANGQILKWNSTTLAWEPSEDQLGAAGTTDGVVTAASFTGTATKTMTLIRSNGLGDITATFTDMVNDADADPTNELQTLSLSGDQLSISSGNTVTLPTGTTYSAGTGIDIQGTQIINTMPNQPVSINQGTGITVSGTYPAFTIANSSPNQVVNITGTGATTVSGTYPNYTISSTDNNNTYTAGSGITINGSNQIINMAPDQTVNMSSGTGVAVSGTYPDFTITNTSPDQLVTLTGTGATTVTGTYPNYEINSTDNNTTYTAGTGLNLTGTVFSANNTDAIWNANQVQGVGVNSTAPASGQVLKYDGTSWAPATDNNTTYTAGSGLNLTGSEFSHGSHTGDVTGTTALTVTRIQGRQVTSNAPANGQVLKWNTTNNRWELGDDELGAAGTNDGVVTSIGVTGTTTKTITLTRSQSLPDLTATFNDEGSSYSAGTGMTLTGSTFNAQTTNALWNANQLQSIGVSTTTPSSGQVLKYNGSSWAPAADNAGTGTITSIATNNGITGGTITTTGTIGLTGQALALHNLATNGIIVRTATGVVDARSITGSSGISVTNGNGVSGNPTISPTYGTTTGTIAEGNHTHALLTRGTGLTGSNYNGSTATTWAVNFGTTAGTVSEGNHAHTSYGAAGTNGMVQFNNNGAFGGSANLFWDNTNTRLGIGTNAPLGMMVVKQTATTPATEALFEVKDKLGHTVFAVYEDSVKIFVSDDGAKTNKGAFAVSGRNTAKSPTNEYLRVTPDSVRVFIDEDFSASGDTRGGFAIGGFSAAKSGESSFLNIEAGNNPEIINPSEPRVLWYPAKEAFMAGRVLVQSVDSVGLNSWATGFESKSIGNYSQALGYSARAYGNNSTAIGNQANAIGNSSFALGDMARATGTGAYAIGSVDRDTLGNTTNTPTKAIGNYSFAFGLGAEANKVGSFSIGNKTIANGTSSVAIGNSSTTTGGYAVAIGRSNTSSTNSFTLGSYNTAGGAAAMMGASFQSVAIGYGCEATGDSPLSSGTGQSVAIGRNCYAKSYYYQGGVFPNYTMIYHAAVAIGREADADGRDVFSIGAGTVAMGRSSYAFGKDVTVNAEYSYIFGLSGTTSYGVTQNNTMAIMGGKVGIGTVSPNSTLQVVSDDETVQPFRVAVAGTSLPLYRFSINTNGGTVIGTNSSTAAPDRGLYVYGDVVIGTTAPTQKLDVNGNARFRAIGSGAYSGPVNRMTDGTLTTATSDRRLKDNITPLEGCLNNVLKLQGVSFTWKDPAEKGRKIGFIAQEVEEIFPELVFTNPTDGYKGINYAEMTAVLTEALKEQQKIIEALTVKDQENTETIQQLQKDIEQIKAMLNKQE